MDNTQGSLSNVGDAVLCAAKDLSASATNGRYINLKNMEGVDLLLVTGIGTAGDDPEITLTQARDASGTGAKPLNISDLKYKVGATGIGATQDAWVTAIRRGVTTPAASYDSDPVNGAENEFMALVSVLQSDLDINNGFTHVRMNVPDVGNNAQVGTILALPIGPAIKGRKNTSYLA